MRTIILTAILAVMGMLYANAQDLINPPKLQVVETDTVIFRGTPPYLLGWNWGAPGDTLDEALMINSHHEFDFSSTNYENNMLALEKIGAWNSFIIGGRDNDYLFLGQSLYLEPTIEIDSTVNFSPRDGDNTGAVFGFQNRNFNAGDTKSIEG